MLSFKELSEKKKTNVLINPKKKDLQEKNHGEDCDCMKCEKKRRSEDVNDGPDIATEESCGKGMYYCHDDKKCKPIPKGYKEGKDGMLVAESKAVGAVVKQLARIGAKKLKSKKVKKAIYKKGKEIAKKVGSAGLEGATDAAVDRAREVGSDTVKNVGKKKKKIDEAKVDQGKDDAAKQNERNQRMFGNRRGSKGSAKHSDDTEARRYNTEKGRGVKMRGKKDKTPVNYHKQDSQKRVDQLLGKMKKEEPEVYWSSKALDQLDEVTAKERMKRDAGAIAKKKMRQKEHNKYVNFLDVDENTIHSFNTFIQNNKPYDSQEEVSEESDQESKVETSLLRFSECWKTHKKVGMKMKGGKLVNDCRPKNEEVEVTEGSERSYYLDKDAEKRAQQKAAFSAQNKARRKEEAAAKRRKERNNLRRQGKYGAVGGYYVTKHMERESVEYTGPDKKDRKLIKKMDNPSYAKKLADYEKNMDPKKRQALKDKATKGMKFTHEAANPAQQAAIAIDMKKKGKKPKDIQEEDKALDIIRKKYKDQIMKRGQPKKVKGAKSTVGTGKYKKMADQKKQTAADAKKRGFKSTQDYVNTMARYGGKDNYDKGKGLGS